MAGCELQNFSGRRSTIEFALSCGDVAPNTLSFLPFGSVSAKNWNLSTQSTDNTSDLSDGFTSSIATHLSLEATVSGFAMREDGTRANLLALETEYLQAMADQNQPVVWLRYTTPAKTYYAFCLINSLNRTGNETDTETYEMSFGTTATGTTQRSVQEEATP